MLLQVDKGHKRLDFPYAVTSPQRPVARAVNLPSDSSSIVLAVKPSPKGVYVDQKSFEFLFRGTRESLARQ